jgi:hypothetical protein
VAEKNFEPSLNPRAVTLDKLLPVKVTCSPIATGLGVRDSNCVLNRMSSVTPPPLKVIELATVDVMVKVNESELPIAAVCRLIPSGS